jgi:hypothetical protein
MTTNQIITAYVENLFQPSKLGSNNMVYDLNIGEFSWIQSIEWSQYYDNVKNCVTKSMIDLKTKLDYDVYTIVLGYSCQKIEYSKREFLFARKYPVKKFLLQELTSFATDIVWTEFFTKGLFFEKETESFYAQWWQIPLDIKGLDRYVLLLKNINIPCFAIATQISSKSLSEKIFDRIIFPMFFNKPYKSATFCSRDMHQLILENQILYFGTDDIEDGRLVRCPSASVFVQGSTDMIKLLINTDTMFAQNIRVKDK